MQISLIPMFGWEDSPAKTYQWREWARELGFEGHALASFTSLLGYLTLAVPEFLSSRTFQGFSLATEDGTSVSSFERWPTSGMAWDGVCLTASISESPSLGSESTLLDVVMTGEVPQKYFLSAQACSGILVRAARRGKKLPALLNLVLTQQTDMQD